MLECVRVIFMLECVRVIFYVRVCESDLYVRVCVGIVSPLTFQSGRNFSNFLSLPPAENT